MKYNHMYTIAFEVENDSDDGSDTTDSEIVAGLLRRIAGIIDADEIQKAVDGPEDTYEYPDNGGGEKQ